MSDSHTPTSENILDAPVMGLLRRKAQSLVGRAGLMHQDREDLVQELALQLLQPLQKFDPARGERLAFVQTLIDNLAANLLRDRQRDKRDPNSVASLSQRIEADEHDLSATVGAREQNAVRGTSPRDEAELTELALDVAHVLERLPDDIRAIAVGLMSESLTALARRLDVPRSTLRDRLLGLRNKLRRGNLDEF